MRLREIAYVIKKSSVLIGIDSAFAHFANAMSVPFVAILGKFYNFEKYMPYSGDMAGNRIINNKESVSEVDYATVFYEFRSIMNSL